MRKLLKVLHTLAACGLIGGLAGYVVLLVWAPQGTPEDYAGLRTSIAALSNHLLLPALAVALVSGLFSMAAHTPYMNRCWAWLKALTGILMFRGVLTIAGAEADHAAAVSARIASGTAPADALDAALVREWWTLGVVMALSVANVVLGIWRPRLSRRPGTGGAFVPDAVPAGRSSGPPQAEGRPCV